MPLPKIRHPIYEFHIPSSGFDRKKVEPFRPFLVKEEKLLLMAKASEDSGDMLRAIKQVVNNCAINDSFDVDKLAIFDLEYLFIQLRSVSVNNVVKVSYRDNEDQELYNFEIDLKEIEVKFPEKVERVVKITDEMGIQMRYPPASLFDDKEFLKSGEDAFYELIVRCIDKIYDGDDIFDPSDYTKKEIEQFLDDVGVDVFQKIQDFMSNVPKLYYKIEYKNKNGNDRVIELTTLSDFFTLD
jgi:hypothetical protein